VAGRDVVIEADGGSRGNPGPAGYGALLRDADSGEVIAEAKEFIGRATNNVAEYRGLIAGLELYVEHTPDARLEVRMDSKLVIEQMAGNWKIKHADMRPLAIRAQRLAPFGTVWTWVPRAQNKAADALANQAMDAAAGIEHEAVVEPETIEGERSTRKRNPMFGWSDHAGTATTVVLLRHGVTQHTLDKRFCGPGGLDPVLVEEGRQQAARSAAALEAVADVETIITSPMRRTRDTADEVARVLGLPVQVDDGFREASFGAWDAQTFADVRRDWPDELDRWLGEPNFAPPGGGEAITAVQVRVEEALQRVLTTYPGQTVVIVSHVTPIKLAVRYALQVPVESINRMQLAPASLTTLTFFENGASLLRQFSVVP